MALASVPTFFAFPRIQMRDRPLREVCVMSRLRIFAALALISVSLLALGVDFFVVGEPVGSGVIDLVRSGLELQ